MTVLSIPAELTSACAHVSPGGPADAVAGKPASFVAAPASTEEAAAVLHAAASLGLTVVPRGTGSRLQWGPAPASCDLVIDTGNLDQILEHTAGDLVVSVQAGVRLDDLARVLAAAGQRLAVDPLDTSGTIGGLIATGAAGPLRYRYGSPRDLLIGITVIRADGTIAKAGGKVVKNVAGYDIGKLFAGSYGTLGLIAEATFRLHPLPESTAWITLDCPDPPSAAAAVQTIADSPVIPSAIELDWPRASAPIVVGALLEGDGPSVAGRADRLGQLLERATAGSAGGAFRVLRPSSGGRERPGTLVRVAFWAGKLVAVLSAIRQAGEQHGLDPAIGGSAGAGVLDVVVDGEATADAVGGFVAALRASLKTLSAATVLPATASAVVLDAPAAVREAVDMWGPVQSLALMRSVKEQFDPEHRMAPGRLPGGI